MASSRARLPPIEFQVGSDEFYLRHIRRILCECSLPPGSTKSPARLTDELYIGNYNDAANVDYLKKLGITHVLNCAAFKMSPANPYPRHSGIVGYLQFTAQDNEDYNILQHYPKAKVFISAAVKAGGRVLVHCAAGINRSGAICAAYLMSDFRWDLLGVITRMKSRRTLLLTNRTFQKQLIHFARQRNLLKPPKPPKPKEKGRRPPVLVKNRSFLYLMS